MNLVMGIDVSRWEPRVDWRAVRTQGVRFAFIRATSGRDYTDSLFTTHWEGAKKEGILRGAYHYLVATHGAAEQADHFIRTVGTDEGELPPVVDLEDHYNGDATNKQIISTCEAVLKTLEKAFGRKPILYSRKSFLQPRLSINGKPPGWAKNCPLWLAQYPWEFNPETMPNKNMPEQPSGWLQDWIFWQYSEKGILEGVTDNAGLRTACDLDWFRGTETELYQFANVQPPAVQAYRVRRGDTLKEIADRHNLSLIELLDANPSLLQEGTDLMIPGRVLPISPSEADRTTQPDSDGSNTSGSTDTQPERIYVVIAGDTLGGIAQKFKVKMDEIMKLNPQITDKNKIGVGWKLEIPNG